ncbi:hypothetical protein [Embleya scabrispora]|uniref:hypothetical protein n=1 Tax=Embleya scabrispora TaxID=159449 RepID=UPI0013750C48|nr:hypothetical protein [Embleya scabrispora]
MSFFFAISANEGIVFQAACFAGCPHPSMAIGRCEAAIAAAVFAGTSAANAP